MEGFQGVVNFLLGQADHGSDTPAANICRDFLVLLSSGPESPDAGKALEELEKYGRNPAWGQVAALFSKGADLARKEVVAATGQDKDLREHLHSFSTLLRDRSETARPFSQDITEGLWRLFCPQAVGIREHWQESVQQLRKQRSIEIDNLCQDPIRKPAKEILFTSNALLTLPPKDADLGELALDNDLRAELIKVMGEDQAFWYDHPIQIGTARDKNEILYGLRGLSDMLRFEKARGNADPQDRLDVVLSASVTHPGLKELARTYISSELSGSPEIRDLNVYVFSESTTARIIEDFLCPAARRFGLTGDDPSFFSPVFGVDGPYGRHYNFLKAVAALWPVAKDPNIRATFKTDLDQVFPQEQLVKETGQSAFELLCSPLWGARGRDSSGRPVSLGMLAGALVNESDIAQGLFTPDVTLSEKHENPAPWIFASQIPQALSTVGEMMTRYGEQEDLDGTSRCISRVHVTGGTVGIRVDSLHEFRPFTLSCIGRAEDQAYLISVLHRSEPPYLRYVHLPGLIMRHDKHAFAGEAILAAAAGKTAGDYERMLLFSYYARALPWPLEKTRSSLDPFTGCFVLSLPATTALLSLALKTMDLCTKSHRNSGLDPEELLKVGASRLLPILNGLEQEPGRMGRLYEQEKQAWDSYYTILEKVAQEISKGSEEALHLTEKAKLLVEETRVNMD